MSLNGALQIGRSAIVASQAGLQVAGNNMANASTPGYTRQVLSLSPAPGETIGRGQQVGLGVRIDSIARQIDEALQARLRDAISQENGALIDQRFLIAIETLQNELTDNDISTLLSQFFNSFSELANNPEDNAVRTVVVQQGSTLADGINQLRSDYDRVLEDVDRDLGNTVLKVNDILDQLASVNIQIAQTEQGVTIANSLRDMRDQFVTELAQYMDVSTVEQANGAMDVFVGSLPIVLAGRSRGVELRTESINGQIEVSVRISDDQSQLQIDSGRIGALLNQREATVRPAIDDLNEFAGQLIFQVNRVHSQGQGRTGFTDLTGTYGVEDPAANLNATSGGLPFRIENGSFFIHVTHDESGARTSHQVNIDGNAMSMNDLVNEINVALGIPNVTAGLTTTSALTLAASAGYSISFSDDSSGALAALGVNTYFDGRNASDIRVNSVIEDDPNLLAAGADHIAGSGGTAIAIANLQDVPIDDLNGTSLREFWLQSVNTNAVRGNAANASVQATQLVRESLAAQVQAVSGVSIDEEAINLLSYQRQFQAAARFISVIDETMQILLSLA